MPEQETTPTLVTHDEINTLIKSINTKFAQIDQVIGQTTVRTETILKLLCQNGEITYSTFVKGLRQFQIFSAKVESLKKVAKISDRIKQTVEYNDSISTTDEMVILADDINILSDVVNAETISKENVELCDKLDSTYLFKELLNKYVPKV